MGLFLGVCMLKSGDGSDSNLFFVPYIHFTFSFLAYYFPHVINIFMVKKMC